jgi:small subunit ribosomal protein S16
MALKIRLRQQGRKNRQTYRLVVTDVRAPRDGKYIELVGWYQPAEKENTLFVDAERVNHWLAQGAQLSDQARALVSKIAPEVIKGYQAKVEAKRVRLAAKRKAARKAVK